ncbi:MAG: hypothetical protein ABEK02_01740 [Haloquadratum sp.]
MNAAVDAAVCLLLVSAAVAGLVSVDRAPPVDPGRADAVADALATTTAAAEYSVATTPAGDDSSAADRTARGTLAGLLARAAVTGEPLARVDTPLRRAVRETVRARTGATVRVDARWRPYPGAPVGGSIGVGPTPPSGGVHAATLVVPTGVRPIPTSATVDFDALSVAVAERTVSVLVPAGPARVALRSDGPTAGAVHRRYARLSAATNTSLSGSLATEDAAAANRRLAAALAPAMAVDLRAAYDTPAAAAEAVSVSTVRIVVRTWRPSAVR